jgi:hypothetical protein
MSSTPLFSEKVVSVPGSNYEILRDYRQRRADEERERAEVKRLQVADQRSGFNDAKARIRAWETVHGLRLPASPTHPVLAIIAAATELSLSDVQEEQRLRSARTTGASTRAHP